MTERDYKILGYYLLAIWVRYVTNQNPLSKKIPLIIFEKKHLNLVRAVCSESCTYGSGSIY